MSATRSAASEPGPAPLLEGAKDVINGTRRRRILIGISILVGIALAVLAYWVFFMRGIVYSDDARIGGHLVDIAPEVNGTLQAVNVREGQYVRKGAIVFELNSAIPIAALHQAQAGLVAAEAQVALNEALCEKAINGARPEEILAAQATVRRLRNEEAFAHRDLERSRQLLAGNTISQDDFDRARTDYVTAQESRENAQQNLLLLQRGSRGEDIAAAKAAVELARSRVKEAEANVRNAEANLARDTVRAPFDGWIVRRWLEPGAMPLAAQPIISMFDPSTIRIDANIEEQDLSGVEIGDRADIELDAFPSVRLEGRVTEIMRAVNSEFSLIPSEGVAGTFIKVTQRVPIRIAFKPPESLPLGPGLSAEIHIHSGTASGAPAKPGPSKK